MKLLDTNELIRLHTSLKSFDEYEGFDAISIITYIEFLSFEGLADEYVDFIKNVIRYKFVVIGIEQKVADLAAGIRRGHKIRLGDSMILATALVHNMELVTGDLRLKRKYAKMIS